MEAQALRKEIAKNQRFLRDNPMISAQTLPTNAHADRAKAAIIHLKGKLKGLTMPTKLTKAEQGYIRAMFQEEPAAIKNIKDISKMKLGCVALFMENREHGSKDEWPGDHSISEKYLAFHKLPLTITYKEWEKWLTKQPKHLR